MPRRSPLVCQYVENLSSDALERYADIVREMLGRQHGMYALYQGTTYKARLRKDGTIRVGKRVFNSPSLAAEAIVMRPING